jgi:retron-type reverse transcriptase
MTTDPFAAYFDDAHRQWQHLLEHLGDKQELEMRWQEYLNDASRVRMKHTPSNNGKPQTDLCRRRSVTAPATD